MSKTKRYSKKRILALLCAFCMVCSLLPMSVFAASPQPQESPELVITNSTRDFDNCAIVGDTLDVTTMPDWADASMISWYNANFDYGDALALTQTGVESCPAQRSTSRNYQYCTVTNPDSGETLYSNLLYVNSNKAFIPAEQLEVGQVIPTGAPIGIGGIAKQGYKYMVVYNDNTDKFDEYCPVHFSATWTVQQETVVIDIEDFPEENGGWPEDTWTGSSPTSPAINIKGESTYKVLTVPYVPYDVTHTLGNITATPDTAGDAKAADRLTYRTTLTADLGYVLPPSIGLTIDGVAAASTDYTYDAQTGEVVVLGDKISGDITLTATAAAGTFNVAHTLKDLKATPDTTTQATATFGIPYRTKLTANPGYALPQSIGLTIDGDAAASTDYTYDAQTGEVVVLGDKILGDIVLTATASVLAKPPVVLPPVIGKGAPNAQINNNSQAVLDAALTEADKQAIANGADYSINLKVEKLTPSAEDKAKMESALGQNKIGLFLDISMIKTINGTESKIENLNNKIKITLDIPTDLQKDGRAFSALRLHNGVTEFLEDLDTNPNTITFETDKFSTYALTYTDKSTQTSTNLVENDKKPNPKTGGNMTILPIAFLAFASFGTALVLMKKKEHKAK